RCVFLTRRAAEAPDAFLWAERGRGVRLGYRERAMSEAAPARSPTWPPTAVFYGRPGGGAGRCRYAPTGASSEVLRLEVQRDAVHAVAQARGAGAVREDMAEMAGAAGAAYLDAAHAVAGVDHLVHRLLVERGGEARPARAAVIF